MNRFDRFEKGGVLILVIIGTVVIFLAAAAFYGKSVAKNYHCVGCGKVHKSDYRRVSFFSSEKDTDVTEGCCNLGCIIGAGFKKAFTEGLKEGFKGMAGALDNMTGEMMDNAAKENTPENNPLLPPSENASDSQKPVSPPAPAGETEPSGTK
jgi:hypothetical protein